MSTSRRRRSAIAASAALAALAAPAAFAAPPADAAPPPDSVKVVNTLAEAIPVLVQNVLQVTGAVSIEGPVQIDDAAPVRVAPVEPAGERVQVFKPLLSGLDFSFTEQMLEVPAGKRFVAEQVNGEAVTHPDGDVKVQWGAFSSATGQPRSQTFVVPLTHQFTDSFRRMSYNEEMHFTVDGPGVVTVTIQRFGRRLDNEAASPMTLVGRLVDCPSCGAGSE